MRQSSVSRRVVIVLMVIHALLVSWCSLRSGFAWTEVGLLPAGVLDWRYGSYDVFRVNPPLVRMWATLPVLALNPDVPFAGTLTDPRSRAEWEVGAAMLKVDALAAERYLTIARLFCLPFSIAGMWVAVRWAKDLFGTAASIGAAVIWTFFPMLIGYECLISGDAQAACMGLVTFYCFRGWLKRPDIAHAYFLGIVLGLTLLTKTSWFILIGLLPMLWVVIRTGEAWLAQRRSIRAIGREAGLLVTAVLISLCVVNTIYGFAGSFRRLDSFDFISKALAGTQAWQEGSWSNNRFRGTILGALPVPLPESLVIGVDLQKWDFDRERWSYFRGQWRTQGWWYYYVYGLAIKMPLGFWILFVFAAALAVFKPACRGPWQDELLLWIPMILVIAGASLETGLNRHLRYVLPALPPAIVLASRAFCVFAGGSRFSRALVVAATAWLVTSSLWIFPHSLSYFNESIGGPKRSAWHMNASNIDWGQDLTYLRRWQQRKADGRPLYVKNYLHLTKPEEFGIEVAGVVPSMYSRDSRSPNGMEAKRRFMPGWYAVDRESILRQSGDYAYLNQLDPADWAGYGFVIFDVTEEVAQRLEREWNEGGAEDE